ncbi:MAG: hypothetical protein ACOY5W_09040 [Pseudomonadota bacterium]
MGTVFQIINAGVKQPYLPRTRVWLEPGYAKVLWPGLMAVLAINRVGDEYQPALATYASPEGSRLSVVEGYRYSVIAKALRLDDQLRPVGVLVEVATDQKVSAPGLRA